MTTTDTLATVYLGTSDDTEGGAPATVLLYESDAAVFYADAPSHTYAVTCDACMSALYVVEHGTAAYFAPHLSTDGFTGCLPCMVGAVAHGGGYIADADMAQPSTYTPRHRGE